MKKVKLSSIDSQSEINADKDYLIVYNEDEKRFVRVKSINLNSIIFQNQIGKYLTSNGAVMKIRTNMTRGDIAAFFNLRAQLVATGFIEGIDFSITSSFTADVSSSLLQRIGNKRLIDIRCGLYNGFLCLELINLSTYVQFNLTLKNMSRKNIELQEDISIDSSAFKEIVIT